MHITQRMEADDFVDRDNKTPVLTNASIAVKIC
jgi:hypothetical protein